MLPVAASQTAAAVTGAAAPAAQRQRVDIVPLTGLRFFAASSVALAHAATFFLQGQWWVLMPVLAKSLAFLGMSTFFVLSGFVIHYNYGYRLMQGGRRELVRFWVARFARLYPLFILLFVLELLTGPFINKHLLGWPIERFGLTGLPFYPFLAQSWFYDIWDHFPPIFQFGYIATVAWSISTEWLFYLAFPLLCPLIVRLRRPRVIIAAMAGVAVLGLAVLVWLQFARFGIESQAIRSYGIDAALPDWQDSFFTWLVYISPYSRIAEFVLGCLVAQLYLASPGLNALRDGFLRTGLLLAALATVAVLTLLGAYADFPSVWTTLQECMGFGAPMAVVILCIASDTGALARCLRWRWVVIGGEASYGLYLLHLSVYSRLGNWPFEATPANIVKSCTALLTLYATAVGLSIVVHYCYEAPARAAVRRWLTGSAAKERLAGWLALLHTAVAVALAVGAGIAPLRAHDLRQALPDAAITVISATYGANCRPSPVTNNARPSMAAECNGKQSCDYRVDVNVIGNPAGRCDKAFEAYWVCGPDAHTRRMSLPAEAGLGSIARLTCLAE